MTRSDTTYCDHCLRCARPVVEIAHGGLAGVGIALCAACLLAALDVLVPHLTAAWEPGAPEGAP